jgi:hypothetical protein
MIQIPLGHDRFALIDDCDADLAWSHTWCLHHGGHVLSTIKCKLVALHILIGKRMFPNYNGMFDHEDRNKLNCQRPNLRRATSQQNCQNRGISIINRMGFKGVKFNQRGYNFSAQIKFNYKSIHLGVFLDPIEAAKAYDAAAKQYFGEFAFINFKEST